MEQTHLLQNKWVRIATVALLSITTIFVLALTVSQFRTRFGTQPYQTTIAVSGTGEVAAVPDIGFVTFEVRKEGKTAGEAQTAVTTIVNPLVAGLKEKGIAEADIKTTGFSTQPVYDYVSAGACTQYSCPPSKQVLRGYESSATYEIKLRDTDKAGDMLSYIGSQGVTTVSGLSFTIDDPESIRAEARAKAIASAKAKADVLADQLGVKLVRIISFYEDNNSTPRPMYDKAVMGMGGVENAAVAPSIQVQTGENTFVSNVNITYEIR